MIPWFEFICVVLGLGLLVFLVSWFCPKDPICKKCGSRVSPHLTWIEEKDKIQVTCYICGYSHWKE